MNFEIFIGSLYFFIFLRVRLVRELGREGRDFNGGKGRRDILIKNVFGSQGEGERF